VLCEPSSAQCGPRHYSWHTDVAADGLVLYAAVTLSRCPSTGYASNDYHVTAPLMATQDPNPLPND
jgi:hypothetical protein